MNFPAETYLDFDVLSGTVVGLVFRSGGDLDVLYGRPDRVYAGVALGGQRLKGPVHIGAGTVPDGAAHQCARPCADANAVIVVVAGLHGIAEGQRGGAAAVHVRCLTWRGTDQQGQRRRSRHMNFPAETYLDFDVLSSAVVGIVFRSGGDLDVLYGRPDRVYAVSAVRGQRLKGSVDVGAAALDGAAHQRTWPGANAYAVSIVVTRLHGIPESQRLGTAALQIRCLPLRGTDQHSQRKRSRYVDFFVEADHDVDVFSRTVGGLVLPAGIRSHALGRGDDLDPFQLHRRRATGRFHLMAALLPQRRQPAIRFTQIVAGAIFNGAAHERVGANRNAVLVVIATLHHIVERQRATAALLYCTETCVTRYTYSCNRAYLYPIYQD